MPFSGDTSSLPPLDTPALISAPALPGRGHPDLSAVETKCSLCLEAWRCLGFENFEQTHPERSELFDWLIQSSLDLSCMSQNASSV